MNAKISVFVICVKVIIYLLLYGLHECTFKGNAQFVQKVTSEPLMDFKQNHYRR